VRRLFILFIAELQRAWLEQVRYPLQFVLGLVLVGLIFYLLLGVAQISGVSGANPAQVSRLLVGYLLGLIALGVVSSLSNQISKEAKSGTLENMVLSGHGLTAFFVVQTLARFGQNLFQFAILFFVLAHLSQINYTLSWQLLPAFVLFLIAALGLGLALGAVELLFKETSSALLLLKLLVFPAVIAELPQLEWFPLVLGASIFRELLQNGVVEGLRWLLFAVETVALYSLGVFLFQSADLEARKRGLLGHE